MNALTRIATEEGVKGLWAGAVPTMSRACALNCAMMVSYEKAKEAIVEKTGKSSTSTVVNVQASMISAFATAFFSLPFDNIKTKMQKQKPNA